jgi:hypothetical protein
MAVLCGQRAPSWFKGLWSLLDHPYGAIRQEGTPSASEYSVATTFAAHGSTANTRVRVRIVHRDLKQGDGIGSGSDW